MFNAPCNNVDSDDHDSDDDVPLVKRIPSEPKKRKNQDAEVHVSSDATEQEHNLQPKRVRKQARRDVG